jgi:hypothetical protein
MRLSSSKVMLLSVLFAGCFVGAVRGQPSRDRIMRADSCEEISLKLDRVGREYAEKGTKDSVIIIIGDFAGKSGAKTASSRSRDASRYLTQFYKVKLEKIRSAFRVFHSPIVTTQFFVNGELVAVINSTNRSRLCFGMGETFH